MNNLNEDYMPTVAALAWALRAIGLDAATVSQGATSLANLYEEGVAIKAKHLRAAVGTSTSKYQALRDTLHDNGALVITGSNSPAVWGSLAEIEAICEAENQAKIEAEIEAKIEAEKQAKIEAEKQAKSDANLDVMLGKLQTKSTALPSDSGGENSQVAQDKQNTTNGAAMGATDRSSTESGQNTSRNENGSVYSTTDLPAIRTTNSQDESTSFYRAGEKPKSLKSRTESGDADVVKNSTENWENISPKTKRELAEESRLKMIAEWEEKRAAMSAEKVADLDLKILTRFAAHNDTYRKGILNAVNNTSFGTQIYTAVKLVEGLHNPEEIMANIMAVLNEYKYDCPVILSELPMTVDHNAYMQLVIPFVLSTGLMTQKGKGTKATFRWCRHQDLANLLRCVAPQEVLVDRAKLEIANIRQKRAVQAMRKSYTILDHVGDVVLHPINTIVTVAKFIKGTK